MEDSLLEGIVTWIRIEFCMLKSILQPWKKSLQVISSAGVPSFSTAKSSTGEDGVADKTKCVLRLIEDFEIVFLFWKIAV